MMIVFITSMDQVYIRVVYPTNRFWNRFL